MADGFSNAANLPGFAADVEAQEPLPIGGELCIGNETTEVGYFSLDDVKALDVMEPHYERISDAFAG